MESGTMDVLFYDIECFPFNSFVVFKNVEGETVGIFNSGNRFRTNRIGDVPVTVAEFIQGYTLIGYNNYWYDDHMLEGMCKGWTAQQLKALNDKIIVEGIKQYPQKRFQSLDTFQQIDVSMPSLKKIEANMSKMIMESSVPFDIDRPLTPEEYYECIKYCEYDISMTIEVYKMRIKSYFQPKQSLVEMVGNGQRWNTTTLSANALLDDGKGGQISLQKWSDIRLNGNDFTDMSMLDHVPLEVRELWLNSKDDKGKATIEDYGCKIEFGFGGLHGVNKKGVRFENVKLLDVASMYPHIILEINALGNVTEKYHQILLERITIKHKDKITSDALKLLLNSVYGLLKNQYSPLFNPKAALSVCIYGQIALYQLGKMLSPVATIVQLNTDGVAFIPHGEYEHIWKEWEEKFNLTLEQEEYDVLIQRDINSYIGVKGGQVVKCKGGDVSRYFENVEKGIHSYFKNTSARILDVALVNYLVYGTSVIDTLVNNLDKPHLYQYIIQAGSTYKGTFDLEGNKYNKINRIFPTKKGNMCLYKKRVDDGLVRFPDTPEKMYLWNDDCENITNFDRIIDLNHYAQIINKRLDKWV